MEIKGYTPHPSSASRSRSETPEGQANDAEREASRRISEAGQRVMDAEHEADQEIDHIRDEYLARESSENARGDAAIENQKQKGYEQIRELQRRQQAELNKIRRQGEYDQQKLQDYYKQNVTRLEHDGNEKVHETEQQKQAEYVYAQKNGEAALQDLTSEHQHQLARLHDHQEEQTKQLNEQDRRQYQQMLEYSEDAQARSRQHFQERYQSQLDQQDQTLNRLYNDASHKIREVRQDTSQKLAAYSSRQRDPFYKMMETNARVSDEGEYFELRAKVPEHEQDHVSAIVRGNQLVLQGYRRNDEKLDMGEGHSKSSASYQSFQETFPLDWPVDAQRMTREFHGDTLVVRVPKKNEYAFKPSKPPLPPKARAEKPRFPENIPHTKPEPTPSEQELAERDKPSSGKSSPGNRTLA